MDLQALHPTKNRESLWHVRPWPYDSPRPPSPACCKCPYREQRKIGLADLRRPANPPPVERNPQDHSAAGFSPAGCTCVLSPGVGEFGHWAPCDKLASKGRPASLACGTWSRGNTISSRTRLPRASGIYLHALDSGPCGYDTAGHCLAAIHRRFRRRTVDTPNGIDPLGTGITSHHHARRAERPLAQRHPAIRWR